MAKDDLWIISDLCVHHDFGSYSFLWSVLEAVSPALRCYISANVPSFPNSVLLSHLPEGQWLLPRHREVCRIPETSGPLAPSPPPITPGTTALAGGLAVLCKSQLHTFTVENLLV